MEKKTCTKCGEIKELTEFSKRRELKSGFHSRCKACANKYRRAYAKRIGLSTYNRRKEVLRNYDRNNPDRVKARREVLRAVRMGELKREICMARSCEHEKVHAHHYLGYGPEHWLDVLWLCQRHHSQAHSIYGK